MAEMQVCIDCGNTFSSRAKHCSCGWTKGEKPEVEQADHRCHFMSLGRRCPLPGTICPSLYGSRPWYCIGHYQTQGDQRLGEVVLIDAEENYQKILEGRRDWRTKLFK